MRRTLPAVLTVSLMLLAVPATAAGKTRAFRTPSGNVACLYSSTGGPGAFLRCDVFSEGDVAYRLRRRGHGRRIRVTDSVSDPSARVLRYGRARNFGPFRCRSRVRGLTCRTRANGHGFFVSRERQRTF
jgi:hypothetical protein